MTALRRPSRYLFHGVRRHAGRPSTTPTCSTTRPPGSCFSRPSPDVGSLPRSAGANPARMRSRSSGPTTSSVVSTCNPSTGRRSVKSSPPLSAHPSTATHSASRTFSGSELLTGPEARAGARRIANHGRGGSLRGRRRKLQRGQRQEIVRRRRELCGDRSMHRVRGPRTAVGTCRLRHHRRRPLGRGGHLHPRSHRSPWCGRQRAISLVGARREPSGEVR